MPTNSYLYAHNLTFDGSLILNNLPNTGDISIEPDYFLLKNGNLYGFTLKIGNKFFHFRCSYRLIPLPLHEIGDIFNIAKIDFPLRSLTSENIFNLEIKAAVIRYCKRDVQILNLLLIHLHDILVSYPN